MASTSENEAQDFLPLIPGFHAGIAAIQFQPSGLNFSLRTFKSRPLAIVMEDRDTQMVSERPINRFSRPHLQDTLRWCDDFIVDTCFSGHDTHHTTLRRVIDETQILLLLRTSQDRAFYWAGLINHCVGKPVRIFSPFGVHLQTPEAMRPLAGWAAA